MRRPSLLLHGFPTSSRMFRNLIPALAGRYRVVAPDYPGFGHSAAPERTDFTYSFANFAKLVDGLLAKLGINRYALYVQDYGAPVGFRLALLHPERVSALVIQNGNAYDEGLSPFWDPIRAYWANPSAANRNALRAGLTREATRSQYIDGVRDPSRIDPENWLDRSGPAGSARRRRDHARPLPRLREQRDPLSAVPALLPRRAGRRH